MRGALNEFRERLLKWYGLNRRELPWRLGRGARRGAKLDPYHVLVSEAMLQQTQVGTVVPYFLKFVARFPTAEALAQAEKQEVLRLWQGLGYYARARHLQAAARAIMSDWGGKMPTTAQELRSLPGVGRYTAGAVASIAFDEPAAIVDGNVARVLVRVDRIERDTTEPEVREGLWARADELVRGKRPGDFNSAMMELGATVCTPKAPKCLLCPVAAHCEAVAAGAAEKLPLPKKRCAQPLVRREVLCIRHGERWLLEQRPAKGRWASMWQFITMEAGKDASQVHRVREALGLEVSEPARVGQLPHGLPQRRDEFEVHLCAVRGRVKKVEGSRVWTRLGDLDAYPMSRPHLKVAKMLEGSTAAATA
jgi:A/G-specific adenine glycosylase